MTSGARITLTYNLYFNAKSTTPANALLRQPDLPSRVSQVGKELRATLASLLAREDFLPLGGYLGFGLRFMYPLDMKKPVAVIGDSLKGCDAMIKIVCDELGLPYSLKAMYRSTSDVYDGMRVFVARDTFWKGTGPYERIDTEVGCPYETYTNKTSIVLRPAGAPPLTDYKRRVKPTEEVKWITEVPKDYNVVKSTYSACCSFLPFALFFFVALRLLFRRPSFSSVIAFHILPILHCVTDQVPSGVRQRSPDRVCLRKADHHRARWVFRGAQRNCGSNDYWSNEGNWSD